MHSTQPHCERLDACRVRIPRHGAMRTDGIVYASERLLSLVADDPCLQQVANVAALPGIVGPALAMPDIHWGYGFPIGGVAAFDPEEGVVSPGGVGYDINCGVRLLSSRLTETDVRPVLAALVDALFAHIPSGVGSHQHWLRLDRPACARVCRDGAAWAVAQGLGGRADLDHIEDRGALPGADFDAASERAFERGRDQIGTLGSGNHFVEVQVVDELFEPALAARLGLQLGGIAVAIHTGSRGFGYQVCDDTIQQLDGAARRYGIALADRQLACAPIPAPEAQHYLAAMAAAANFAFANRQVITHRIREAFEAVLRRGPADLGLAVVYDVAHNIAKFETHTVAGRARRVLVHRKGATRALPAGHPDVPASYRDIGQPVLIPGDMGRASYVLVGAPAALTESFGSACHGAGRVLSRHAAQKHTRGRALARELGDRGIVVRAAGKHTLGEEAPEAYKDVSDVVDVVHAAGLARRVARLRPLGVIKG